MGYKMKSNIPKLLGINPELSTYDVPVFEKDLPKNLWGAALIDRTIHINKNISNDKKKHAVEHEMMHVMQFRSGQVNYDKKNIYYRATPFEPIQTYVRSKLKEGSASLPWEKAIYDKTGKYAK
jgi:Zn-dependent peptidase ImmA (M78 family)